MIKENAKDFLLPTEKTMGHTPHGLYRCMIIDKMRAKKENSCQKLQRTSGRKISLPSKNKDTGEDCPNYKNHHYTLSSVGGKIKDKPDR